MTKSIRTLLGVPSCNNSTPPGVICVGNGVPRVLPQIPSWHMVAHVGEVVDGVDPMVVLQPIDVL